MAVAVMYAVLLNLIVTGEIRSVSYRDRWHSMERTLRMLDLKFSVDWANASIISYDETASFKWRKQ
jgi:hypothetical protein